MRRLALVWFVGCATAPALRAQDTRPALAVDRLDARLAELVPAQFPSLAVGIVRDQELVYARAVGVADGAAQRPATLDTVYRIGSISKVFTATLLVALRDEGRLRLDDPLSQHLPPETPLPQDPRGAPAITLRHLATHTAGLPRDPVNLAARTGDDFGGYAREALYAGLERTPLRWPVGSRYSYSNLGVALLGQALERAGGEPYEALLRARLLGPLHMSSTEVELTPALRERLALGYDDAAARVAAPEQTLGVLAPAGALYSTVPDLGRFLSWQFDAGSASARVLSGGSLTELHTPQRLTDDEWRTAVALGWHVNHSSRDGVVVWHNGGMRGYRSIIGFSPRHRVGAIVLTNRFHDADEFGLWLLRVALDAYAVGEPPSAVAPALERIAKGLAAGFVPVPPDSILELFHPNFLAVIRAEQIKQVFALLHAQHGAFERIELEAGNEPNEALVLFKLERSTVRAHLAIDESNEPRIVGLRFLD